MQKGNNAPMDAAHAAVGNSRQPPGVINSNSMSSTVLGQSWHSQQ